MSAPAYTRQAARRELVRLGAFGLASVAFVWFSSDGARTHGLRLIPWLMCNAYIALAISATVNKSVRPDTWRARPWRTAGLALGLYAVGLTLLVLTGTTHHGISWATVEWTAFIFMALGSAVNALAIRRRERALDLPPCMRIRRLLSFVLPSKVVANVIEPTIADVQHEWLEARVHGHRCLARWLAIRGPIFVGIALAAWLVGAVRRIWSGKD